MLDVEGWLLLRRRMDGDCWLWTQATSHEGYGTSSRGRVHRIAYELWVRPLEVGEEVDHTCHRLPCVGGPTCQHRRCFNPQHLEAVTRLENSQRVPYENRVRARVERTTCRSGHEMTPENTYRRKDGRRVCRICRQASQHRADRKRGRVK